jgi:hypothetical protein
MAFNLESELLFVQSNPTLSDKPKTHPMFSVANLRFCESNHLFSWQNKLFPTLQVGSNMPHP